MNASNAAQCEGKFSFNSMADARNAMRRLQRKRDHGRMTAYHCTVCHGFHFGHTEKAHKPSRMKGDES